MYYDSSNLTKKDRIRLVIDMYKEGATRPEIASATNFNFGIIKKIIDDMKGLKADKNPEQKISCIYALRVTLQTSVSRHKT